jgi:diguanylate cyclase (GGDEF)-like protein
MPAVNRALLHRLYDPLDGGVLLVSTDGQERVLFASAPLLRMYGCASEEELERRCGGTLRGMVFERDYRPLRLLAPEGSGTCLVSYHYQNEGGHFRTLEGTVKRARLSGADEVWVIQLVCVEERRAMLSADTLTGLPGKKEFEKRALQLAERNRARGTIEEFCPVRFNLTNFREYNRLNGSQAGDACLRMIAGTLSKAFPGQLLCHLTGDLFEGLLRRDGLEEALSRVARVVDDYTGNDTITLKAGIYLAGPKDDRDAIVHSFDMAKLACDSIAKDATRSYAFYTDDMGERFKMRMYIVENFDRALRSGYIRVFFQPVVRTMSGRLCGFEALSRWQDPERGEISPAVFVPVLEDARLVGKLDAFVVDRVARVIRDRQKNGLWALPVSFNLSKIDFDVADPFSMVETAVQRYAIPRECMCVEVTESVMAYDRQRISEVIGQFHSAGYQVWLDDFGSEYSSLNSLHRFDFDELKIDMGFFSDFDARSRKIITSIVAMAKLLGVGTLAEGVESEEQVRFLRDIGCGKIQGYYYGRPMSLEECMAYCERRRLRAEYPDEGRVYAAAEQVNFITELPTAVFSASEGNVRILHENEAYRAQLGIARRGDTDDSRATGQAARSRSDQGVAYAGRAAGEADETPRRPVFPLKGRLNAFLERVARDGRRHSLTFVDSGSYYKLDARKIAGDDAHWLGEVNAYNISDGKDARSVSLLDRVGRYAVHIYDGIYLLDVAHDRIDVLGCTHFRVSVGQRFEGIGGSFRSFAEELVHPDDRERFVRFIDVDNIYRRFEDSGRSEVGDLFRVRREDGAYHWTVYHAIVLNETTPRNILLCEREDIWEAKTKADRDQLLPVMVDSMGVGPAVTVGSTRDIYRELVLATCRNAGLKLFWKDADLRYVGASDSLLRYFGIEGMDGLVGKSDAELGWHVDCAQVVEQDRRILQQGESKRGSVEHLVVHGELRLVSVTEFPYYDGNRVAGVAGYFVDLEDVRDLTRSDVMDAQTGCLNARGMLSACVMYHDALALHGENYEALLMSVGEYSRVCKALGAQRAEELPKAIAAALLARAPRGAVIGRTGACRFMCLCKEADSSLADELLEAADGAVREFGMMTSRGTTPNLLHAVAWGTEAKEADGVLDLLRRRLRKVETARFGEVPLVAGGGVSFAPECFEGLPDVVFVLDPKTYELVYANRTFRDAYGIPGALPEGAKCYEILEGRDAPCEKCPNDQLRLDAFHCHYVCNSRAAHDLLMRDTLALWHGRTLRFSLGYNLSDFVQSSSDADLQALYEIGANDAISTGMGESDPDRGIRRMIERISQYLGSERIMVFEERDDDTVSCTYEWCHAGQMPLIDELQGIRRADVEALYRLFRTSHMAMVSDFEAFAHENPDVRLHIPDIRNFVSGHLVMSGASLGFTMVVNVAPSVFKGMEALLSTLTSFIAVMLRNRSTLHDAMEQSRRDLLTGALNRRGLQRFFDEWKGGEPLALISCDLNGLKEVNDERGHAAGDSLIAEAARTLIDIFDRDHVVRMGGDEFVAIAQGYDDLTAQRAVERIKGELAYRGISMAVGYAVYDRARVDRPHDAGTAVASAGGGPSGEWPAVDLDALAKAADRSMYQDKARMYRRSEVMASEEVAED